VAKPLTVEIPQSFINSANNFAGTMNKFLDQSKKMQAASQLAPHRPRRQQADPTSFISQFRRMNQIVTRLETSASRSVDLLSRDMGGFGRLLLRNLNVESLLARLPMVSISMESTALAGFVARVGIGGIAGGPVGVIASIIAEAITAAITKTIALAPTVFRDSMQAMGLGTGRR
jgi:hypothetical protein